MKFDHAQNQDNMERDEFYKHRLASSFSKGRKIKARVEVYEERENGSFKNKATGRIMTAKTFEIYKPAAAMDGITTIIMEPVLNINTDSSRYAKEKSGW